jgi:hypothetical protein
MPDQFEVKKQCESVKPEEFYRFIYTYYFYQEGVSWTRTQNLLVVEGGVLAAAFSQHGQLAILALAGGSVLVFLIWRLIQRDWQIRDQYIPYFDEFHKDWGVKMALPAKGYWYRGRHIINAIIWSVIVFNLCSALGFAFSIKGTSGMQSLERRCTAASKWPEPTLGDPLVGMPHVIPGQMDVFPAQWQ